MGQASTSEAKVPTPGDWLRGLPTVRILSPLLTLKEVLRLFPRCRLQSPPPPLSFSDRAKPYFLTRHLSERIYSVFSRYDAQSCWHGVLTRKFHIVQVCRIFFFSWVFYHTFSSFIFLQGFFLPKLHF